MKAEQYVVYVLNRIMMSPMTQSPQITRFTFWIYRDVDNNVNDSEK